jgi:rod shape determining protein RodA
MATVASTLDRIRSERRFDWWLVVASVLLLGIGLASLYSIDHAWNSPFFGRQLLRIGVGLIPFMLLLWIDPHIWRRLAVPIYLLNLFLLYAVLVFGRTGGGAQRWIEIGPLDFQPSELAKLFTVLFLSAFLIARHDRIQKLSTFVLSFVLLLPSIILLLRQPHLGAILVLIVAWLAISLIAGVRVRLLVGTVLAVVAALVLALQVPGLLKDYHVERVRGLLNPDEQGNAYQVSRAMMAFGSGGTTGVGFLRGEQKAGKFIPEQQTDFIFTVIGEEGGLVGCTIVLGIFAFFFYRIWLVMFRAQDLYYRMLAAGIFAILGFHAIVNMGMNLGLLPVVGLWLPFVSYGGSAMWLCMGALGLLLGIKRREKPVLF